MMGLFYYRCTHCGFANKRDIELIITSQIRCINCAEDFLVVPEQNRIKMEEEKEQEPRKRHGSPDYYKLLQEMAEMHDKKSHDYATNDDPYGNYKFAGRLANLFSHSPDDAGFVGRLGEKIFRLAVLEGNKLSPRNESIADTETDICVLVTLWMTMRREKRAKAGAVFTTPQTQMNLPTINQNNQYIPLKK